MESKVISKNQFEVLNLIRDFIYENSQGISGAILFFVGKVRKRSKGGKEVKELQIESYRQGSNKRLKEISEQIKKEFKLNDVLIVHAEGSFKPGENLVLVGIASNGRKEALGALAEIIKLYKAKAFIFKKEVYTDGTSSWISATDD